MFEKSLYDLIRGLRNHKGSEREYIQESIRECRKEIRGSDMDLKATALLKLTYLEMFGHDMSWASFNVLEVMSSPKYLQKRVGYLAAIQSFRPDTEVLMLAENLLKKDLTSPVQTQIALPLAAIPHVINPSMANSLLSDLLPRLTHSNPNIRKKTIVTLYRLALVYPETLRPTWPKIKDRLQDESEDPSVTSAIVNVVCELGWRRPQDFLPLAPRLFDLLVQGGNNWMAIKIIKLFATLTPLEPRLVKKLLPPLTSIIKTTPAMSLLYECINGIVQGGILESVEGTTEGEEIAKLCVGKLRSMLVVEGDPNLKYVALLAFQKIVTSHPYLVSLHQDVILECIDDADISIRMRALDLVVGMVSADNLVEIVSRLLRQLENAPLPSAADDVASDRGTLQGVEPYGEDDSDMDEDVQLGKQNKPDDAPLLPEEYRISLIKQILTLCSQDTYSNVNDFDWYIAILVKLVRVSPATKTEQSLGIGERRRDVSDDIGEELLNVAVRVRSMRREVTAAAQSLLLIDNREILFPPTGNGGTGVLGAAAWIAGEFANLLSNPDGVLTSLMDTTSANLPAHLLATYVQAMPKIFCVIGGNSSDAWSPQRRTIIVLLLARIVHFLEPLTTHPNLEVQERAVEFLELFRLASEAANTQAVAENSGDYAEPPLLLTSAIPGLFQGQELNPVAPGAQKKVPLPSDIDLDVPINSNLQIILRQADYDNSLLVSDDESFAFYNVRTTPDIRIESAAERLDRAAEADAAVSSYQGSAADFLDASDVAARKKERKERNKDDPFYIGERDRSPSRKSGTSTPLGGIIRGSNGEDVDIDSIPIMDLDIGGAGRSGTPSSHEGVAPPRKPRRNFDIVADESLPDDPRSRETSQSDLDRARANQRTKKSLLQVDSSSLGSFSLDEKTSKMDYEARQAEEQALRQVETLRMEMERARERIAMKGDAPEDGIVVKKKKKKPKTASADAVVEGSMAAEPEQKVKKKKKTKGLPESQEVAADTPEEGAVVRPKRKKKRVVNLDLDEAEPAGT